MSKRFMAVISGPDAGVMIEHTGGKSQWRRLCAQFRGEKIFWRVK